jgi:uncharacterized protein
MSSFKDSLKKKISTEKNSSEIKVPEVFEKQCNKFLDESRAQVVYTGMVNNCIIQVSTSPSKMEGYLSALFLPDTPPLDVDDIHLALHNAKVTHGITDNGFESHMHKNALTGTVIGVLIAEGTAPVSGKPGELQMLKRPYSRKNPEDLISFDAINAEEIIAEISQPIPSVPGVNVFGEAFNPPVVKSINYKVNNLIHSLTADEKQVLMASVSGHVVMDHEYLQLKENLDVEGDVTVHRGYLTYDNSVSIKGDITDKVSANIGKNLSLTGLIASADVQVQGHLQISKGIFGKGEANIEVGGELYAKYLNDAKVTCQGNIYAGKEVMNSITKTYSKIDSEYALIVGGQAFAYKGVNIETLGSQLGVPTLVTAGLDPEMYRLKVVLVQELEEIEEKMLRAREHVKIASTDHIEHAKEILQEIESEFKSRQSEIEYLEGKILPEDKYAEIRVFRGVFPGVKLMIGMEELEIREKISGPVKFAIEGKVIKGSPFKIS